MTANRLFPAVCLFAAVLISWTAASAQEVPKRRTFSAAPAAVTAPAASQAAPATASEKGYDLIELSLHKAKVITLPQSVSNIIVGDPTILGHKVDPNLATKIILRPRAVGMTNIFFMDSNGGIISRAEVRVISDQGDLKAALAQLLPDSNIKVTAFRDSIFLTGKVSSAAVAANAVDIAGRFAGSENVVNMMSVSGGQQVILQVRVAEMNRAVRKDLAATATLSKSFTLFNTAGRGFTLSGASTSADNFGTATLFAASGVLSDATFETLERQSLVKTLAEPTLTAISGETASFLSGGEYPFASGIDDNGNTIYEFKEYGIRLEFTPTVIDEGRINLHISTEISGFGDVVDDQQSLTTKRTETTIELPSGGSLMISGLLVDDMSDTIDGFPYLKDIPILGALFRSTAFSQNRTELVITVTAYLVKPLDDSSALSLPTDGFEAATDLDIYLLGRLHRHYSGSEETFWDNPLKGPFGYMMK